MSSADVRRARRRLTTEVKDTLRALRTQLALLNQRVAVHVELRSGDIDCLEVIARYGPISPSELARRAGVHPATMTGVLDRLERGGWITRERDPQATDRRAVAVRALPDRGGELYRAYAGMNALMDDICADYTDDELRLIADFMARVTGAGRDAADDLSADR